MTNRRAARLTLAAASAFLVVGAIQMTDTRSEADAIRSIRAASNRAIAERDFVALRATWIEDLHVTASSGRVFNSAHEMEEAFAEVFRDPSFITYAREPTTIEPGSEATMAAESGQWVGRWCKPDGEMILRGSYMTQWRKLEGEWKIRSELFVALSCEGSAACSEREK